MPSGSYSLGSAKVHRGEAMRLHIFFLTYSGHRYARTYDLGKGLTVTSLSIFPAITVTVLMSWSIRNPAKPEVASATTGANTTKAPRRASAAGIAFPKLSQSAQRALLRFSGTFALRSTQLTNDQPHAVFSEAGPRLVRDRRQLTDGLARGTYPIAFGAEDGELQRLRKEGLPVTAMFRLEDMQGSLSSGDEVGVFNHAPHPNAARIFVKWIASREGNEIFGQALGMVPARNDTDESGFVPQIIPWAGVDYFDPSSWEFTVTTKEEVRLRMKDLLRGR